MIPLQQSLPPRLRLLCVLVFLAAISYVLAKCYSPSVVEYVVEETLVQKAPAGMDSALVRGRLAAALAARSEKNDRLMFLLEVARSLEKHQKLTPPEIERLLHVAQVESSAPE